MKNKLITTEGHLRLGCKLLYMLCQTRLEGYMLN